MSEARSVVVDGVQIPERLIAEEAQNHPAATAEEARRAAGHALAIRALLLERARALGLSPEAVIEDDGREETPEEALIRAVLDAEVVVETPDEAECRRVYDGRREKFRTPELIEASHILCSPGADDEDAWETARTTAAGLIAELATSGTRFAELAKAHSDCPSKGVGGSLGQLGPGDLAPEVEAGLARLRPGETASEPTRSRFGWHVLRLDRRIDGRDLPFEHVHDRIALHLESRAWTAAATRYVADLAAEAREHGVGLIIADDGRISSGGLVLGDLLDDSAAVAARVEPWLEETDAQLAERIRIKAESDGATFASLVRDEIAAFVRDADDERWTQLISAAQGAEDPALACVRTILRARLEPPARTFTLIKRN